MVLATGAALVIGAVLIALATRPAGTTGDTLTSPPTRYAASLTDGAALGSKTAPVVIQMYADFQCPACRQFVTGELPSLLTDYINPGTVRIEALDIDVLGHGSPDESLELAAGAACAAEQDRYWQFHDLVYWNQGRENRGDHDAAFIAEVADQAGVDRSAWDACLARSDVRSAITSRTAAATAAGISSTPTFSINGTVTVGVPKYDELAALIDQLARAASPAASPAAASPVAS
jgi:protein-disulfide isomerase